MRASDIGIVPDDHASVVTSGAAGVTIRRITDAGIPFIQEGGPGTYRDTARSAPYNLFAHLTDTAKSFKQDAVRPADYLPWGDGSDLPEGKKATTFAAAFSGGHQTQWKYDGQGYVNLNSNAGADDQFPTDTVLSLQVEVGDAGYLDPAGNYVPETHFVGSGPAWLFHEGRVIRATWTKDKLTSTLGLEAKGKTITVPAGHVWVELVPAGPGNVTWQKWRAWRPSRMIPMAASTRSLAASGSSASDTDSPADDIAPKKIRANVRCMASSIASGPVPSTLATIASTLENVERSSCSRNLS